VNGTTLLQTLQAILPASRIEEAARDHGVITRKRKLDIVTLVRALVLSAGSDDSGKLADARRRYLREAEQTVVRGAFYAWMDEELAVLMEGLLEEAMYFARSRPAFLPGILAGVDDWLIFDSETITLRAALEDDFRGSGSPAAIKVHKELSVGRGCMTYCHFGPAREHDAPNLVVDERYRNKGMLVDLGYASLAFIRDCRDHGARYVMRLKDNWKPRVTSISRGEVREEFFAGTNLDVLLQDEVIVLDSHCVDAEVVIGKGKQAVCARLVMIPGPDGYLAYLTNLPRKSHGPKQVAELYRVRFEIELDNKLDKSGAQLDQIRATTDSSVCILMCAALLHSLVVDLLIHQDKLERVQMEDVRRAPLHRLLLAFAMRAHHAEMLCLWSIGMRGRARWDYLADLLFEEGRDPNWRRRPSVLDRLVGLIAPRGRPRRRKLRDCRPSAAAYRSALRVKTAA